jgi:hypothetical protein
MKLSEMFVVEEDSRGNMMRLLGTSHDVADDLHAWLGKAAFPVAHAFKLFAQQFVKEPGGMDPYETFVNEYDFGDQHAGRRLAKMLVAHPAMARDVLATKRWEEVESLMDRVQERNVSVGVERVLSSDGGWTWVELMTPESKHTEGWSMKHCGRDEGKRMFSLRDRSGKPHVTVSVDGKTLSQAAGKANSPVKRELVPKVMELVEALGLEVSPEASKQLEVRNG